MILGSVPMMCNRCFFCGLVSSRTMASSLLARDFFAFGSAFGSASGCGCSCGTAYGTNVSGIIGDAPAMVLAADKGVGVGCITTISFMRAPGGCGVAITVAITGAVPPPATRGTFDMPPFSAPDSGHKNLRGYRVHVKSHALFGIILYV